MIIKACLEYDLAVTKMKMVVCFLLLALTLTPVLAETVEAVAAPARQTNFLTEFDITFWQTLPFAALWSSVIAGQLAPGGAVNWNQVAYVSLAVASINAYLHAKKTTAAHSP